MRRRTMSSLVVARGKQEAATTRSQAALPVVFGTGLISLDIILSADPNRPPTLAAGGTCGNVLSILSFFGWESFPVARLNGDVASEVVSADFRRCEVALDFACQTPSAPTPIILQRNNRRGDGTPRHRFTVCCPACGAWYPSFRAVTIEGAQSVIEAVSDASHVGFSPRVFFFDRVSRGALLLAEWFSANGAVVVFEPGGIGDPKLFAEAVSVSHVLKYSQERLPDQSSKSVHAMHPILEIETLSGDGLRYRVTRRSDASWYHLAAIPAPALLDTAGAGDWCTAAFLATTAASGLRGFETLNSQDFANALRFGQAAATASCEYEGARGLTEHLDRAAFDARVDSLLSGSVTWGEPARRPLPDRTRRMQRQALSTAALRTVGVEAFCPTCP